MTVEIARPDPEIVVPGASLDVRLEEADRRAREAERTASALRRRTEAAELRVAEARERLRVERDERETALTELTALLDAERRRGTMLVAELEDQATELRVALVDGETILDQERADRSETEHALVAVAHERLAAALADRDATEERLSAHLAARDGDLTALREQLASAHATREALALELAAVQAREQDLQRAREREQRDRERHDSEIGARVADASRRLDTLGMALGVERTARAEGAERERALQSDLERAQATLAGELARRDELLVALRDAELRAHRAENLAHQLALRERELEMTKAEARGATDALARLQGDVASLQAQVAGLTSELHAERVARGTADAVLERERADHVARLAAAEGRGQARLDAERTEFSRERMLIEARIEHAEEVLSGERAAHAREREELAGQLASLHRDIEGTIGALRSKLEAELTRTAALTRALEARAEQEARGRLEAEERLAGASARAVRAEAQLADVSSSIERAIAVSEQATVQLDAEREQRARAERQRDELAAARAGVQRALEASEARAAALDAELRHREDLVSRVGAATVELREHLAATQRALAEEGERREATEAAAREVVLAAQDVLLAGLAAQEEPAAAPAQPARPATTPAEVVAVAAAIPEPVQGGQVYELHRRREAEPVTAAAPQDPQLDALTRRFDEIRAELAARGVRSAERDKRG